MYDPDDYPEGHSPFCHKTCDHPCHDEYDRQQAENAEKNT